MSNLAFFICGGILGSIVGGIVWHYLHRFLPRLQRDIYDSYVDCFYADGNPPPPPFPVSTSTCDTRIAPKCGRFCGSFFTSLLFALLSTAACAVCGDLLKAGWLTLLAALIFTLITLDFRHRLIPPTLCLWLFFLGLFGAERQFLPLTLSESLQSAVVFSGIFYLIYHTARFCYGREALGRGDYWLMLGLGAFLPLAALPLFLLVASLSSLTFALIAGQFSPSYRHSLPFAPFLCVATAWVQIQPLIFSP